MLGERLNLEVWGSAVRWIVNGDLINLEDALRVIKSDVENNEDA